MHDARSNDEIRRLLNAESLESIRIECAQPIAGSAGPRERCVAWVPGVAMSISHHECVQLREAGCKSMPWPARAHVA